jgi:hypothetical protein
MKLKKGWIGGRYFSGQHARKAWTCDKCGAKIEPGSYYVFEADRGPGTNVVRYCETCAAAVPGAPLPEAKVVHNE